jgi:putative thioredoxin
VADKSPWIVETDVANFEQDAVERSHTVPVVVDFWAPWCQPCRLLGPMLENLADEFQGAFVLVKANTEQMPEIAAAFGVQGIPAVFALRDGQVVGQFMGLLPEPQVRDFIGQILPGEAENLVAEGRQLGVADPQAAEAKFREALEQSPNDAAATVALAGLLLSQNRLEESRETIKELAESKALDAEGEALWAEIDLRREARELGTVDDCRAAAEADPENLDLRLNLARALAAAGQHRDAMDVCLDLVEKDRKGTGEKARELMVRIFHLLGDDELLSDYRRKLSMLLY